MSSSLKSNVAGTFDREANEKRRKDATKSASKGNAFQVSPEPNFERVGIETETENYYPDLHSQRKHYSQADEDGSTRGKADDKGKADGKKIGVATAGIEPKIENLGNIRAQPQRRHFNEAEFDGMKDVTAVEIAAEAEATIDAFEKLAKTDKAARVEKKIVQDCEGIPSHRKHFPGSTTSQAFN